MHSKSPQSFCQQYGYYHKGYALSDERGGNNGIIDLMNLKYHKTGSMNPKGGQK
jgi:hypothetical protein